MILPLACCDNCKKEEGILTVYFGKWMKLCRKCEAELSAKSIREMLGVK